MGQIPLRVGADRHHLVLIPVTLADVAQVHHHDDPVVLILPGALGLQGVQGGQFALEGYVAPADYLRQLAEAGDAKEQIGTGHTGLAAADDLFQAAGAQLLDAGVQKGPGHLGNAGAALDDAAHVDALGGTAGDDLGGVAAELGERNAQSGELSFHMTPLLR